MENNRFIGVTDDPFKSIQKIDEASLASQYSKLTDEEKELVFLKLHGFKMKPPDIERLYTDPYYLGGPEYFDGGSRVFEYWKKNLKEIFPGQLTAKDQICLSGSIGTGKSTCSKMIMELMYSRLLCLKDPWKTMGLARKPLSFVIYHRDENIADLEFKRFHMNATQDSPFFKTNSKNLKIQVLTSGYMSQRGLGSDVILTIMGEINFWPSEQRAQERVASMLIRYKNRFSPEVREFLGAFIIDSSAKGSSGPVTTFLENADPEHTWYCCPAHWEVRPEMYRQSQGITFYAYAGDGRRKLGILSDEEAKNNKDLDKDRIIKIPIQVLPDFKAAPEKTLQDVCGVNTGASDLFFSGDISHVLNCAKLRNQMPEIFYVDFYDKTDKVISRVEPMLSHIKPNTFLSIGLDLAVSSDIAAITIASFAGWEVSGKTKEPRYKIHACFGLSRKDGQETSLAHIYDFIMELSRRFNISVSYDHAFSKSLAQDLDREGIPVRYLSTDRTPELATYLKACFQYEEIEMPEVERFFREAYDLKILPNGKVDHPKKATLSFDNKDGSNPLGSKDLWDSMTQAIYNLHLYLSEGNENGVSTGYLKQGQLLENLTETAQDLYFGEGGVYQDMLESLF